MNQTMSVTLDGAAGEGGGQILRSALSLSMITGIPFVIERIRARRKKPGLLRQHLTAVQAAQQVCGATVQGAELGSSRLRFEPGPVQGGEYRFAIGTAGSCTLVLQTVLPALWFAPEDSRITVSGGTHNPMAPPADYLIRSWLPLMRQLGVQTEIELISHGFYPAGGGEVRALVTPGRPQGRLQLLQRGVLQQVELEARVADVPLEVAQRELSALSQALTSLQQPLHCHSRQLPARFGAGNVLQVALCHEQITALFVTLGEKGVSSERVAERLAREVLAYQQGRGVVDEHLADQLILPMALAGGGAFVASVASEHLRTNMQVIEKFLPVTFELSPLAGDDTAVQVSVLT
ncbi:RNA 3'-terminal phosphate cyclase [Leeia aquatica]|nr:RNA 3'-terminal phosphate cyclase [Leeia aquatica]